MRILGYRNKCNYNLSNEYSFNYFYTHSHSLTFKHWGAEPQQVLWMIMEQSLQEVTSWSQCRILVQQIFVQKMSKIHVVKRNTHVHVHCCGSSLSAPSQTSQAALIGSFGGQSWCKAEETSAFIWKQTVFFFIRIYIHSV